ncbi:ATP-binding cassette domain-containing protein [Shewanella sp. YIC-542]|uniref:ATP-binding cassette domain-containing protein n=1 Tax=Shewanella mytili TaxID=3377111 RepID=UPI00398F8C5E
MSIHVTPLQAVPATLKAEPPVLLQLQAASVRRGRQTITLPDITLYQGQRLGLFGPSGCGKSTLASVLAGQQPLASGQLQLATELQRKPGHSNPVQWIIQQPELAFNPRLTMADALAESWRGRDFSALLPLLGVPAKEISRWYHSRPGNLSGGELQRLNILRALVPETRLLICDEITAQLDMLTQQSVWQELRHCASQQGLTLLVISHDRHLLQQLCDPILQF